VLKKVRDLAVVKQSRKKI